jgi:hypothetical protein
MLTCIESGQPDPEGASTLQNVQGFGWPVQGYHVRFAYRALYRALYRASC